MYEYDDDGDEPRSRRRPVVAGVGVVVLAALGWAVWSQVAGGDDAVGSPPAPTTSQALDGPEVTTDDATATSGPEATAGVIVAPATTTVAAPTTAPTTSTSSTTTTTVAPTTTIPVAPFETLPDGTPMPLIVTFDTNRITLQGVVPDQAAMDRIQTLAVANAKPGQADLVDNQLTLNPAVPRNVGVRVLELTSARFPDGSAEILPEHAAELDRVVTIMNALHARDDVDRRPRRSARYRRVELRHLRSASHRGEGVHRFRGDRSGAVVVACSR